MNPRSASILRAFACAAALALALGQLSASVRADDDSGLFFGPNGQVMMHLGSSFGVNLSGPNAGQVNFVPSMPHVSSSNSTVPYDAMAHTGEQDNEQESDSSGTTSDLHRDGIRAGYKTARQEACHVPAHLSKKDRGEMRLMKRGQADKDWARGFHEGSSLAKGQPHAELCRVKHAESHAPAVSRHRAKRQSDDVKTADPDTPEAGSSLIISM